MPLKVIVPVPQRLLFVADAELVGTEITLAVAATRELNWAVFGFRKLHST